jgi:hypothetical protein
LKITTITAAFAAAAAGAAAVIGAPSAFADDLETQTLGEQAELVNGDVTQSWTVSNLKTSTDVIPYPVRGTLWEATATDEAVRGNVTPIVSNLNARARSGETYRALFQVATPQGVNPSTLAQGQKTTGKVYFDVTGDTPDSVVYNAGGNDVALWVQPPPSSTGQSGRSWPTTGGGAATTPAEGTAAGAEAVSVPPAEGTAATEGTPGAPGTTLPTGSQGTPITPGSQGTPITPNTQGTTPVPAGEQGTPVPAGNQGTPVPAANQGTPAPAGSQGTPAAAGSQGTPAVSAPAGNQPVIPPVVVVAPPSA